MKTKLFFSFLFVILIALISNFIFRSLMQNDFEDYVRGVREDRLYWVLASVEGSYEDGHWERALLIDSLHWGMMLGFDLRVSDNNGTEIIDSQGVLDSLEDNMRRRMESIIDVSAPTGDFEDYPLFVKGKEIGTLSVRGIRRRGKVAEKENVFIERGKEFLIISFIIAGGGAIFLALVFSTFLTNPVKRLKEATARLAKGDTGIKVDISSGDEIGELAESFNFMSEALKREDMIRRHLSSNIAHELRTPLTIMKANLEGIADGVIECSQEQIESLKEEVDRLISLVEGIEDITRAEASFLRKDVMEEVDVKELIEKSFLSVRNIANSKGVELVCDCNESFVVVTDREKLDRILKNLVTNALKFTEGGRISVSMGFEQKRFFIRVSDTGRGMDAEEIRHIFDRFYKGKGSKGAGIGLSIVRELVDALGGEIEVKSGTGEGSTFIFYIPRGEIGD